ncbi:unnamed protein product [Owenia fusiformis]|uniref:Folylpolyglutamate synthase n=1 Tax=Owenia fusiformis TaxID=6347 RepID=A0A8J1U3Y0_OWEFU|nr:unnamed protein product [Owenia fusiformis]
MNIWGRLLVRNFSWKPFKTAMIGGELSKTYEEAVQALNTLQSNASVLEKVKKDRGKQQENNIPDVLSFAQRAGVTVQDIDNLSIIHVSGTKGKGSTCAFCERILRNQGYKTGFYSSPHLIEVRERIRINGKPLSRDAFSSYFWDCFHNLESSKDEFEGKMPAYFRFLTIMAFHVFRQEQVDVAIFEVGIGGQYDCTNVIRKPVVCGVTSLGIDHTSILGDTVEKIAWHKAGIFKSGSPAVTVQEQPGKSMEVMLERAAEKQSSLSVAPKLEMYDWQGLTPELGIPGELQHLNASLALQLSHNWMANHNKNKSDLIENDTQNEMELSTSKDEVAIAPAFSITPSVADALKSCFWPGRNQTIKRERVTYYVDGAHTPKSIEQCVHWFQTVSSTEAKGVKGDVVKVLVFNATGDRQPETLMEPLLPLQFDYAVFCPNIGTISTTCPDRTNFMVTKGTQLSRCIKNRNVWLELMNNYAKMKTAGKNGIMQPNVDIAEEVPAKQIKLNSDSIVANQNGLSYGNNQSDSALEEKDPLNDLSVKTLTFPCISDTLVWVSQGKDDTINSSSNNILTSPIPQTLTSATHIQVLVTGSIHLVGGVLGVLDPDLTEC